MKKVTRWHCCWKILKRLIKVVITPLLSQLQGWPGWQKNGTMLRYLHLVFFCAKIEKILKTIRKQGVFDDFLSILAQFWIFWHPGHPWSCESSRVGKIRRSVRSYCPIYILWPKPNWYFVSTSNKRLRADEFALGFNDLWLLLHEVQTVQR